MSEFEDRAQAHFVPRAQFDETLGQAKELLDAKALWWRLSSTGVEPRLDRQMVQERIKDDKKRRVFERVLNREIVWALDIIALDYELSQAFTNVEPRVKMSAMPPAFVEDVRSRVAKVHEVFATREFRERAILRRTCKGSALENLTWDISVKKHDLIEGPVADVAYAKIELTFSAALPAGFPPLQLRRMFSPPPDAISFDFHVEDLEALIRELGILRDNLRRLGAPAGGGTT